MPSGDTQPTKAGGCGYGNRGLSKQHLRCVRTYGGGRVDHGVLTSEISRKSIQFPLEL